MPMVITRQNKFPNRRGLILRVNGGNCTQFDQVRVSWESYSYHLRSSLRSWFGGPWQLSLQPVGVVLTCMENQNLKPERWKTRLKPRERNVGFSDKCVNLLIVNGFSGMLDLFQ